MKPEDTDRYIQQLFEEIDNIPSLEWNETQVWNKIKFKLMFAWFSKLALILLILSIVTVYMFRPKEKQQPVSTSEKILEVIAPIKEIDSTKKIIKKNYSLKEKHMKEKKFENNVTIISDELIKPQTHLFKAWKIRPTYHPTYHRKNINFYTLNIPDSRPTINLRIPVLHIVNMDVNNSFNTKNLIRSLESNDNSYTYYRYRYNSRYLPDPFNNNMNQQQPAYQPQIIQYP